MLPLRGSSKLLKYGFSCKYPGQNEFPAERSYEESVDRVKTTDLEHTLTMKKQIRTALINDHQRKVTRETRSWKTSDIFVTKWNG